MSQEKDKTREREEKEVKSAKVLCSFIGSPSFPNNNKYLLIPDGTGEEDSLIVSKDCPLGRKIFEALGFRDGKIEITLRRVKGRRKK